MNPLRGVPVHRKLAVITVTASGLALFLACSAFLLVDAVAQRRLLERDLSIVAEIAAYNLAGALEFDDRSGAETILAGLQAETQFLSAYLCDADGALFAAWARQGGLTHGDCAARRVEPAGALTDHVHLSHEVSLHGERKGELRTSFTLGELYSRMVVNFLAATAVLFSCCMIALLLGGRLLRVISDPILELAELARSVSETQDYTLRAAKRDDDEIGLLAQTLNEMLERIERDTDLKAQRRRLQEEVAQRIRINQQLQIEKENAIRATQAKTEFLANMSHEIRTPMTAVLGFIDLIREGGLTDEEQTDYIDTVQRNGKHLMAIINDVLDISKIESGQIELESVPTSPHQIVNDVAALMGERAAEKGLQLDVQYDGPIPASIPADPTRLRQILMNLVHNAVKFTETGGVRVVVAVSEDGVGGEGALEFTIRDTGPGISHEQEARIFQAFAQADCSITRRFGGSGLGLNISMKLAMLMGGSLCLDSEVGRGSTFTLTIPTGPLADVEMLEGTDGASSTRRRLERQREHGASRLSGRVLLAEDSVDSRRLIRMLLQKAGLHVEVAENGREALEAARSAWDGGQPFDLILMDMHMPVLDGYDVTSLLRSRGYDGTIIALTAQAVGGDRDRCLAAGCDDFATKPIERVALIKLVSRYLGRA